MSNVNPAKQVCEFCGNEFVQGKRSGRKYCSYACGQKAWDRKKAEEKREANLSSKCKQCEKEFCSYFYSGTKQLFCSFACKDEYHKAAKREANEERHEQNPLKCDHCQKDFIARRHISERFCSGDCKTAFHAEDAKRKRDEARANTVRTCPMCDNQFSPKKSLKEIYCSPNCRKTIGRKIYKMMRKCYESTNTKKAAHAHKVLGYTPNELLAHLRSFPQWETLKTGTWHLDHVFPIIAFVRKGIRDLKVICSLNNLQPLPGGENHLKSSKYDVKEFDLWLSKNSDLLL